MVGGGWGVVGGGGGVVGGGWSSVGRLRLVVGLSWSRVGLSRCSIGFLSPVIIRYIDIYPLTLVMIGRGGALYAHDFLFIFLQKISTQTKP